MTANRRPGRPRYDDILTPAEWRVVHAVTHGLSSRQIAARTGISVDAVKFHVANALGKLGIANRAALRNWFQAPRHSPISRQEQMMESLTLGAIGQISRSVENVGRSQAWYRDVIGLPHLFTSGSMAFFDCGGTRLALMQKSPAAPDESIIYLRVEHIAAAHEQLKDRGVEFISAPHRVHRHIDGTEEWMAFFKDLEGRPLGLMAQVKPGDVHAPDR